MSKRDDMEYRVVIKEDIALPETGILLEKGDVITLAQIQEFADWVETYNSELTGWILEACKTTDDAEIFGREFATDLYLSLKQEILYADPKEKELITAFKKTLIDYMRRV